MADLVGRTISNRYQVDSLLGRGGMGDVYKVWDSQRGVFLAMKVLHADLAEDKVFLRRFAREAETLSVLQHPHIVRFYGLEQDGRLTFMLMDYVEGTTLRGQIFDAQKPFTAEQVLQIIKPICFALHYAHQMGHVHCDIKPANIMVKLSGDILIADFGIARMMESNTTMTMVGAGTPAYMSPEQVLGKKPVPQTDIYSLGIVLYEMFAGGERPFTGEKAQVNGSTSEKVRWEQVALKPPSLRKYNSNVSLQLEAVVSRCLQKDPGDRYADTFSLLNALSAAVNGGLLEPVSGINIKKTSIVSRVEKKNDQHDTKKKQIGLYKRQIFPLVWVISGAVVVMSILFFGNILSTPTPVATEAPITEVPVVTEVPITEIPVVTEAPITEIPVVTEAPVTEAPITIEIPATEASVVTKATVTKAPIATEALVAEAWIAFNSNRNGTQDIFRINLLTKSIEPLIIETSHDKVPAWSPDGQSLAFESNRGNTDYYQIFIYDIASGQTERLTNNSDCSNWNPSWSPDGEKIVFYSNCSSDGKRQIYLMDRDGDNRRQLTIFSEQSRFPAWSPDGSSIAFTFTQNGQDFINIMDIDGKNVRRLYEGCSTNFSLDGEWLAFSKTCNDSQILLIHPDGSGIKEIGLLPGKNPSFSPNNQSIVFQSSNDIWVMQLDGSSPEQLTSGDAEDGVPVWQP